MRLPVTKEGHCHSLSFCHGIKCGETAGRRKWLSHSQAVGHAMRYGGLAGLRKTLLSLTLCGSWDEMCENACQNHHSLAIATNGVR